MRKATETQAANTLTSSTARSYIRRVAQDEICSCLVHARMVGNCAWKEYYLRSAALDTLVYAYAEHALRGLESAKWIKAAVQEILSDLRTTSDPFSAVARRSKLGRWLSKRMAARLILEDGYQTLMVKFACPNSRWLTAGWYGNWLQLCWNSVTVSVQLVKVPTLAQLTTCCVGD